MKLPAVFIAGFMALGILFSNCSGSVLPVGEDALVAEGKTYRTGDKRITIVCITVSIGTDEQNRENESLRMQV